MRMNSITNELSKFSYNNSCISIGKKKEAHFCIIEKGLFFKRWYVFNYERGKMVDVFKFDNENDACVFFIEKLVGIKMYCLK